MTDNSQNPSKEAKEVSQFEVLGIEWKATFGAPTFVKGSHPHGYWTGIQLAPNLPILLAQLTSFDEDWELFQKRKAALEQLPYSLGGMCYTFFEFIRIQAELVKSYPPKQGEIFVLAGDATDPLAYMLDAFLDHARRLANAIRFYLNARYETSLRGTSLPKSMDDLVTLLRRRPGLLPRERDLVIEYWEQQGLKVKAYRDLAQHYKLLASDCRVFIDSDGNPALYLAIPNNPDVKDQSELSYENPTIQAFLYMRRVLYDSIRFVNLVSACLLDASKPPNRASLGPILRTPIGVSQHGVKIASVDAIDAELRKLCSRLAEEANAAAGT